MYPSQPLSRSTRVFNVECVPPEGAPYVVGTENYMDVAQRRMYAIWQHDNRQGYTYRVVDVTPKKKRARR